MLNFRGLLAIVAGCGLMLNSGRLLTAEVVSVNGQVSEVTLYRGQAMITRLVPVKGTKGTLEVVVTGLPDQIITGSMFAEGGEHIEVRAVQYRNRAVGEEPREEVRKLDEQMEAISHKLAVNQKGQQLAAKKMEYLDKLDTYVAGTGKSDFEKGALDAVSLEKIATFGFEQRKLTSNEQIELEQQARDLNKQLELLKRQRLEITGSASRTVREAVIFLQKNNADDQEVRLNYLVGNCGWSPTYTVRAKGDRTKVQVEYNALIQQISGENWGDVKLTLSTASSSLSAAGPGLAPFRVGLGSGPEVPQAQMPNANPADLFSQVESLKGRQQSAIIQNRNTDNFRDNTITAWNINGIANEFQTLEFLCASDAVSTLNTASQENGEGPSLSYQLTNSVTLPSRSDQQMVRILQSDLPSEFYHVATPLLTSYVYREAELTNNSAEDLLAGPITVYLDGRFVGRGEVPTVARGQEFVVGFGADPQLRVRRELANKSDEVHGGNREMQFTYKLFIENFKAAATAIRLVDRLPVADRQADIRVTFKETSAELSGDKLYVRRERPNGILRWDIEVPATMTGENAMTIDYSYSVEFDRNFMLTSANSTQEQKQEYEELQRSRAKK